MRRGSLVALAGCVLVLTGCDRRESDRLLVATSWPRAERHRMEAQFAEWVAATHPAEPRMARLDWLILGPGDDLARLAARRNPPDVLLGGPATSFDLLGQTDQLAALPLDHSPPWSVVRRARLHLAGRSPSAKEERESTVNAARNITFDDPRNDPISLAWAKRLVGRGNFREGYARLVRAAGHPRRIGRQAGAADAAVERGEAELAPAVVAESPDDGAAPTELWIEGVGILRNAPHPDRAELFLKFLAATGRAGVVPPESGKSIVADALLADLLGATLVDAQDELWTAWAVLKREAYPEHALRWMTEPPPWPPASIANMMRRRGERGMSMMETLAGQIATEPSVRAWLVRSWLSPTRLIDQTMLDDLALAADGALGREPGFRDWLRRNGPSGHASATGEWLAWPFVSNRLFLQRIPEQRVHPGNSRFEIQDGNDSGY